MTQKQKTTRDSPSGERRFGRRSILRGRDQQMSSLDQARMKIVGSTVSALRSRSFTKDQKPHLTEFLRPGRYANDLIRLDDLLYERSVAEIDGQDDDNQPIYEPGTWLKRDRIRESWAQDVQTLQQVLVGAHISVDIIRDELESDELLSDSRIDLFSNVELGSTFETPVSEAGDATGVSMRLLVVHDSGEVFESSAYVCHGAIHATRPERVADAERGEAILNRDWRTPKREDFLTLDESATRYAGEYMVVEMGDDLGRSHPGTEWVDYEAHPELRGERILPTAEGGPGLFEQTGFRSLFAANQRGVETVIGSLALIGGAFLFGHGGLLWIVAALALIVVLTYGLFRLWRRVYSSVVGMAYRDLRNKPHAGLWSAYHPVRAVLTTLSTVLLVVAASVVAARSGDGWHPDMLGGPPTYGPLLTVGFWLLFAKAVELPIRDVPLSRQMWSYGRSYDQATGGLMLFAVLVLGGLYGGHGWWWDAAAFAVIVFFGNLLVRFGIVRLIGAFTALRMLENTRCPQYVFSDPGLSEAEWNRRTGEGK